MSYPSGFLWDILLIITFFREHYVTLSFHLFGSVLRLMCSGPDISAIPGGLHSSWPSLESAPQPVGLLWDVGLVAGQRGGLPWLP